MRYFLVGLPGVGKSHWGKIWSDEKRAPFFDLDDVIENSEGQSIIDIFKLDGEDYFRNLETFYLKKLINNYRSLVISTGGGTACFNNNIEVMNKNGITLFLNPSIEENAARIWETDQKNKRPLFAYCNSISEVQETLNKLKNKRIIHYQKAQIELNNWDKKSLLKLK